MCPCVGRLRDKDSMGGVRRGVVLLFFQSQNDRGQQFRHAGPVRAPIAPTLLLKSLHCVTAKKQAKDILALCLCLHSPVSRMTVPKSRRLASNLIFSKKEKG